MVSMNASSKPKADRLSAGVRAGRELMSRLGGIPIYGTQHKPYYYVPAEKRTYAGLDKCRRCMDTYGPKAACNWQPLVRIAPNLYQAQPCHDCVRYPDVFEEDCCSLNKRLYVYDGDYNRILRLAKKGNVAESQSSEAEEPATLATHSSQPPRSYRRLSDSRMRGRAQTPSTPELSAKPLPIITEMVHGLPTPTTTPQWTPSDLPQESWEVNTKSKSVTDAKAGRDEIEHLRALAKQTETRWALSA